MQILTCKNTINCKRPKDEAPPYLFKAVKLYTKK